MTPAAAALSPDVRGFGKDHRRSAAFLVAATVMLVPANVLPIMSTHLPGATRTDTILSGILGLMEDGSWGIAAVVFAASIAVPLMKIVGLSVLLRAASRRQSAGVRGASTSLPPQRLRQYAKLYATLDFIGRWSMLDIFLVAFLSGAVQFGNFAQVLPGAGALAFAAAVVLTMLATDAFDPHTLGATEEDPAHE